MKLKRRILAIISTVLCAAIIVTTSVLVIRANTFKKGQSDKSDVALTYNLQDIPDSLIRFEGNTTTSPSYAVVRGFTTTLATLTDPNDRYRLVIPATATIGGQELPVKEIKIDSTGGGEGTSAWFPSGGATAQQTNCSSIVSVVVPKSVDKISVGAFNSFIKLMEVELPFIGTERGNTAEVNGYESSIYAIFGNDKFRGQVDKNFDLTENGQLTDPDTIPNGTGTGRIKWSDSTGTSITHPDEVGSTTPNTNKTVQVVVPACLQKVTITDEYLVANHAFFMMLPLKELSISFRTSGVPTTQQGTYSIGERAFDSAANLETVYLPDQISTLREGAFCQCYKLKTVLPQSKVSAYESGTLALSSASNQAIQSAGLVYLPLDGNTNATIPDDTFYNCMDIQNVVISTEVSSIGRYAFGGCSSLTRILTSGELATYNFVSTTYTNRLPSNTVTVKDFAFRSCLNLNNLTIGTHLQTMGSGVFNACSALETLSIPFIGKERGNGTTDVNRCYEDGTIESLFGYIFGDYGATGGGAFKKVFQATTGDPAEMSKVAGGSTSGSTSSGNNTTSKNIPFIECHIPTSLKNVTITNESVIAIGAFMNCSMIENLQIYSFNEDASGYSTSQIGRGSLAGCSGLTTLSIPFVGRTDIHMDQNTLFNGSGSNGYQLGYAFGIYDFNISSCPGIAQGEPWGNTVYYIPNSLTSVELNHQTYVPAHAFYKCDKLETVIIGDETKGMQRAMFKSCTRLTNLTVPFIGVQRGYVNRDVRWYFWWEDIEIRNSAIWFFSRSAGNNEYYNPYITDWTGQWICYVPETLENITVTQESYYQTNALQGFSSLKKVTLKALEGSPDYTSMYIESGIMNGCGNIEQLDIPFIGANYNPNSVSSSAYTVGWLFGTSNYTNSYAATQSVGGSTTTFRIPKNLHTITLDRYFTRIADGAFRNMTSLEQVINAGNRAANVSYLGSYAFENCYNLGVVTFDKASYETMGDGAFRNCIGLAVIDDFSPITVKKIGHRALEGTSIRDVDFSRYEYIGNYAFANCLQLTQVDMSGEPATYATTGRTNFTYVGDHLFADCANLTEVILKPVSTGANARHYVTSYMFQNCTALENIKLDGCVLSTIPDGLFDGCTKLRDNSTPGTGLQMSVNENIERIGANAFRNCKTMKNLYLPETLVSIGQGAFQKCSNLDSMRIPRSCTIIPYGSDFDQTPVYDDYVSGVFYGCNEEKFYLEVYPAAEEWPATWGTNWNCYFPVYIIGDQSENLFTYEYCPALKGYIITGLNYTEVDFAPNGNLLLSGTLKFPSMHDGLRVYGLSDYCFQSDEFYVKAYIDGSSVAQDVHPLMNVNTFILGENFTTMGIESLTFNKFRGSGDSTDYKYVFSQKTAAQAMASQYIDCECVGTVHSSTLNSHIDNPGLLNGLCYNEEDLYINKGIIYYKDAWQFKSTTANGTTIKSATPAFKVDALVFSLDSTSFQYDLGNEIKPKIISVDVNDNYVKYSIDKSDFRRQDDPHDQLYYMLYDLTTGKLDLDCFYVTYHNNVNVGTGRLKLQSNSSMLTGSAELTFAITKRRIDLFYQSGQHSDLYGGLSQSIGYTYLQQIQSLLSTGMKLPAIYNPNSAVLNELTIFTQEYTGERWTNSTWSVGGNVFGVPNDYVFTGTLATSSANAGYYMAYNNAQSGTQLLNSDNVTLSACNNTFESQYYTNTYPGLTGASSIAASQVNTINGFQWITQPRVIYQGANVTGNFEIVVNYAMLIAKRVVANADELDWGGEYNETTGRYEYEYNGGPIAPAPLVIDRDNKSKRLDAKIKTEITPGQVIYPTDIVHTSKIISYDTQNFFIDILNPVRRYNYIEFIVVKAKLSIYYNCTQFTIDEFGLNFTYNFSTGKVEQGKVTGQETLRINKLASSDYITGTFYTVNETPGHEDWEEGTYRSINPSNGKTIVHNIRIFSKTEKTPTGEPVEVTQYYDLENCLDASVKIVYNEFDYDFTITYANLANTDNLQLDLNGVYTHAIPANSKNYSNPALGIVSYSSSEHAIDITFGVDGYLHDFSVKIKNAQDSNPTSLATFDSGDDSGMSASFSVTDFSKLEYQYTLTIAKPRYYTVTKTVKVTPVKGNYYFGDISKEYDRLEADPLAKIYRLPKDFSRDKISFKFYDITDYMYENEITPPIEVGQYKFTATTERNHSQFFEDLVEWPRSEQDVSLGNFAITRRSIYIEVVDEISPFDSKPYDGLPWKATYENATSVTHTALNLLPGDVFNGFFMSRSAEVGIYDGDVSGDFRLASAQPWSVTNTTLPKQNQTGNYKIVYKGKYEILPLRIEYKFDEIQEFVFDGKYHTVEIEVIKPVFGATIYYSESNLPMDDKGWKDFPPQYSTPGTYTIYFKIEAPHYVTEMNSAVIHIEGKNIKYDVRGDRHTYDGFAHGLTVVPLDPVTASVEYCLLEDTTTNLTPDEYKKLTYSSTCPQVTLPGQYHYAIHISHPNYLDVYTIKVMNIVNDGPEHNVYVDGYTGMYDGAYHGPIFNLSGAVADAGADGENLLIAYHEGSRNVANPTWITMSLTTADDGTKYIPIYKNAMSQAKVITVRILLQNYKYLEEEVEIFIQERVLNLDVIPYENVFDNQYHTVYLKTLNPDHYLYTNDQLKENGTVTYRYYFGKDDPNTSENELENIPYEELTVRYHENPNAVMVSALTMLKYKDVCDKQVYLYVTADNCGSRTLSGTVKIKFNDNPKVIFKTPNEEIQYLARPVELSDLSLESEHDGVPTPVYYSADDLSKPITAPTALGSYYVRVEYPRTTNCAAKSAAEYFRIVPRELKIEYDKELQYTGYRQTPTLRVDTGTTDEVLLGENVLGTKDPIDIGDYQMEIFFRIPNPNYKIRPQDEILDFKIVPRKLTITIDESVEREVPPTSWVKDSDWNSTYVSGLLSSDELNLKLETDGGYVDTYYNFDTYLYQAGSNSYELYETSVPSGGQYWSDVFVSNIQISHTDAQGNVSVADYYELIFNVIVRIEYPPLEVTVEDVIVPYDGKPHGLGITPKSPGVLTVEYEYYMMNDPLQTPFTPFLQTDVGEYEVHYKVSTPNDEYKPAEGVAKLTITRVALDFTLNEYEVVYDAQPHPVEYKFREGFRMPAGIQPRYFYFNTEELASEKITLQQLEKFFADGMPATSSKIYKIYNRSETTQHPVKAGTYIAYVYFPETANWITSYRSAEVTIKKRPLYFNYIGKPAPLILEFFYNGHKPVIDMGGFEYDESYDSLNNGPNAGILTNAGHSCVWSQLPNFQFSPFEADCRGEPDNEGYEDPYQFDGDFEFANAYIFDGKENVAYNYYPAVNPVYDTDGNPTYQVQVIIKRIPLNSFEVEDREMEYSGYDVLPDILTPSDGKLVYYYYKVKDAIGNKVDPSNYFFTSYYLNQQDVSKFLVSGQLEEGYYLVYVTVKAGRNFYAWNGGLDEQDYDIDTILSTSLPPTHVADLPLFPAKYKSAYVKVTPKQADVQWECLEKEFDVDEDGKAIRYTVDSDIIPYIMDVYGQKQQIKADMVSAATGIKTTTASAAGSYYLTAKLNGTIISPLNYILNYPNDVFKIRPKEYTIHEQLTEPYLQTYWTKHYDQTDFGEEWFHENVLLSLDVTTRLNKAGYFYRQNDFVLTQTVTDAAGEVFNDSVHFNLDYSLYLISNELIIEANDSVFEYDRTAHIPKIDVTSHVNGYFIRFDVILVDEDGNYFTDCTPGSTYSIDYKYSYPADCYTIPNIQHVDYNGNLLTYEVFKTTGRYRVFYQVTLGNVGGTEEVTQKIGEMDIIIQQAPAQLYFGDTGLDRVYDGTAPSEVEIKAALAAGHFNGTSNDLVIKYYRRGTTDEIPAPIESGEYTITITSRADDDPLTVKNYTRLEVSYDYEIRKREITLVVNADWEVKDVQLNDPTLLWTTKVSSSSTDTKNVNGGITSPTGGADFTIRNSFNSNNSDYYVPIPGLVVSDYFVFKINSKVHLLRGIYKYKGDIPQTSNFSFQAENTKDGVSQGLYAFDCTWDLFYDDQNSATTDEQKTMNYTLKVDFTLDVHYRRMNVVLKDQSYDYDDTQYHDPSANIISINDPNPATNSTVQIYYREVGEGAGAYTTNAQAYQKKEPGVYNFWIKITADEYEDYEARTTFEIKYRERNKDEIVIDPSKDLGKTYDAIPYDQDVLLDSADLLCNYDWTETTVNGEGLPAPSSWTIEYYLGEEKSDQKLSDALESVVDAGYYWYKLTIPAGTVYGPTEIWKKFSITRREYKIWAPNNDAWVYVGYNGQIWTYDLAKNPDNYVIEQASGGLTGLLSGHTITAGVINSKDSKVGKYTQSTVDLYIDSSLGTNYRILNADNENVRDNYSYAIEFDLEVQRGTVEYIDHVEPTYVYKGEGENDYYTPYIEIIKPADGYAYLQYSTDGVRWFDASEISSLEEFRFRNVGDYTLYARTQGLENYYDLPSTAFPFKIVKKPNALNINDLTRQYNGNPIEDPTISTSNMRPTLVSQVPDLIDTLIWYKWDGTTWVSMGTTKPKEVGHYKVAISIKPTSNYDGVGDEKIFDITPLIVNNVWSSKEFEYAAIPQAPAFKISSIDNPNTNVMGLLASAAGANQFKVEYFDDQGALLPGKPMNVGSYVVRFTFINDGENNFSFSKDSKVLTDSVNFSIIPCKVTIRLTGNIEVASSSSTIEFKTAEAVNLPAPVEFDGILIRQTSAAGNDRITGAYDGPNFTSKYKFSGPSTTPTFTFKNDGTQDLLTNYDIQVDINQSINSGKLPWHVTGYKGPYDGEAHSVELVLDIPEEDIEWIEYSDNGGSTWSKTNFSWTDASNVAHYVQFKVKTKYNAKAEIIEAPLDTNGNPDDNFAVIIERLETTLNGDNISLGKVYDGQPIDLPNVEYNKILSTEDRSEYLTYRYYRKDETGRFVAYTQAVQGSTPVDIRDVGVYRLIVNMLDSTNYVGTHPSDPVNSIHGPLQIEFEITKRPIAIVYREGRKDFDGSPWVETIRSIDGEVQPILNNPNSGLVEGHEFNGVIQTVSHMAGIYNLSSQFRWTDSGYKIIENGTKNVTNNYEIVLAIDAEIERLEFDIQVLSYEGTYDYAYHSIKILWNETPKIDLSALGYTSLDDLITYSLSQAGPYSAARLQYMDQGTYTIYFKIEGPNYVTKTSHGTVIIHPIDTNIQVDDYPGKATGNSMEYNGHPYDTSKIKFTLSLEPDRTPTYEFFEKVMVDGAETIVSLGTTPPVDVGNYYFIIHIPAGVQADAVDSNAVHFSITKHKEKIQWVSDSIADHINGEKSPSMIFRGENTPVIPSAYFMNVFDNQVPLIVEFADSNGNVLSPTPTTFQVGYYFMKARLDETDPKYAEYVRNYILEDDFGPFVITPQIAGPGGEDENDPNYMGITFPSPQVNPHTGKPYDAKDLEDEEVIYITAVKHYSDKPDKTVILTVDLTTGEVTAIDGVEVSSTTTPNFKFVIPRDENGKPIITTEDEKGNPQFEIKAQLKDKINSQWNTDGDTDDIPILIDVKAHELKPDHTTPDPSTEPPTNVPDIVIDPYDHVHYYLNTDNDPNYQVTFEITVRVTQGTVTHDDDEILVEGLDYIIYWFNNTSPTPAGATSVEDLASFCVESLPGRKYSFKIGNKETENVRADDAGTFTILESVPQRFQIAAGSLYKFVYYLQDNTDDSMIEDVLDGETMTSAGKPQTRDEVLDAITDPTQQALVSEKIRIGHTWQSWDPANPVTVAFLLTQLANSSADIVVQDKDGVVIYDQAANIDDSQTAKLASGLQLSLYKPNQPHDNNNQLDYIEVILSGDVNGDGDIDAFDIQEILEEILHTSDYLDNNDVAMYTSLYQAGLMPHVVENPSCAVSAFAIEAILAHIAEIKDVNGIYDPNQN